MEATKIVLSDEAKEARRQYQREWRARNREHINAYAKQWRTEHPEQWKASQRRYRRTHRVEENMRNANFWERKAERMHDNEGKYS